MADYQFPGQQNQWSDKPAIGTGEGESPLAPAPQNDLAMRSMASDISSMKEMGGGDPRPYTPSSTTTPQGTPTVPTQTVNPMQTNVPASTETPVTPLPKKSNKLFMALVVIIIVVGLGAIGYLYVYPKFFSGAQAPTEEVVPGTEATTTEQPAAIASSTETSTSTPTSTPIVVPPTSGLDTHVSLFKASADFSSETTLASTTLDAVRQALKTDLVVVPVLKELVFRNSEGKILGSSSLLPLFVPSVFNASTTSAFEEDFTLFTYTDKTATWPGFAVRVKPNMLDAAKTYVKNIEKTIEWKSLFLSDPGKEQTWKDGKVSAIAARYISFSTKGVALSYVWLDNTLLVSTNYEGAQSAAKKLGF